MPKQLMILLYIPDDQNVVSVRTSNGDGSVGCTQTIFKSIQRTDIKPHHISVLERCIQRNIDLKEAMLRSEDPYQAVYPEGEIKALREVMGLLL